MKIIKKNSEKEESELIKSIENKLMAKNIQNQNANVDEMSFGGRMGEARNELMKDYALNYIVSPMARENHLNNEIYIHDLDAYAVGMHNCLTIPFDKLLAEGFNTRQTDVRPSRSINTAFQLVAVLFQLQSLQQFGGVSASHLDWTMVPYVRKSFRKHWLDGIKYLTKLPNYISEPNKEIHFAISALDEKHYIIKDNASIEDENYQLLENVYQYAMDMTTKELMQAVQGMYHNLNY